MIILFTIIIILKNDEVMTNNFKMFCYIEHVFIRLYKDINIIIDINMHYSLYYKYYNIYFIFIIL
jgi:hypothetical protein